MRMRETMATAMMVLNKKTTKMKTMRKTTKSQKLNHWKTCLQQCVPIGGQENGTLEDTKVQDVSDGELHIGGWPVSAPSPPFYLQM